MVAQPAKIQARRGTAAEWSTANPILTAGEFGFATDTGILKLGDGSTSWNALQQLLFGLDVLRTVFTASGNFTPQANVRFAIVELWGGGAGAGGHGANANANAQGFGPSGGAGGYVRALLTAAQLGVGPIAVTIGAGGTAGAAGNTLGGSGGNSTFSAAGGTLTANGAPATQAGTITFGSFGDVTANVVNLGGAFTVGVGVNIGSARGGESSTAMGARMSGFIMYRRPMPGRPRVAAASASNPTPVTTGTQVTNLALTLGGGSALSNSGEGGLGPLSWNPAAAGITAQAGGAGGSGYCRITEFY